MESCLKPLTAYFPTKYKPVKSKSMEWFLYDENIGPIWVKIASKNGQQRISIHLLLFPNTSKYTANIINENIISSMVISTFFNPLTPGFQ